jgi:hypothetical protein
MEPGFINLTWILTNTGALILLFFAWKLPRTAKLMYLILFGWASWVNTTTAIENPIIYLDTAIYTPFTIYKEIILGFFSMHITLIVISIAVCQALIAISMVGKGGLFKTGAAGGIIFLLCIAPLGAGSGFPFTVILAAGLWLLMRNNSHSYIWQAPQLKRKYKPALIDNGVIKTVSP